MLEPRRSLKEASNLTRSLRDTPNPLVQRRIRIYHQGPLSLGESFQGRTNIVKDIIESLSILVFVFLILTNADSRMRCIAHDIRIDTLSDSQMTDSLAHYGIQFCHLCCDFMRLSGLSFPSERNFHFLEDLGAGLFWKMVAFAVLPFRKSHYVVQAMI